MSEYFYQSSYLIKVGLGSSKVVRNGFAWEAIIYVARVVQKFRLV
jgi:hypothetical protein